MSTVKLFLFKFIILSNFFSTKKKDNRAYKTISFGLVKSELLLLLNRLFNFCFAIPSLECIDVLDTVAVRHASTFVWFGAVRFGVCVCVCPTDRDFPVNLNGCVPYACH